jgi:hypothetical protein
VTYLLLDTNALASIARTALGFSGDVHRVAGHAGADYLGRMSSRRLGQAPARRAWRLSLTLILGLALAGSAYIATGQHRRFASEAAEQGWLLEGGNEEVGLSSSTVRDARLSWQGAPGVTVDIEQLEMRHWPWLGSRVTVRGPHIRLRGEIVALLRAAIGSTLWKHAPALVGPVDVTYDHRALGSVDLKGVVVRSLGSTLVLQAERLHVGKRDWHEVTLALEPRKEAVVVAAGDGVAGARVQLTCFPSSGGNSRWLLDILHQPVRPLASRVGWDLGSAFDASWVAGAVSLDIPDDTAEPLRGRMQLVVDGWATAASSNEAPWLGATLSLLSNLLPAPDGRGWELPRVELTLPVFELLGKGRFDLGEHPSFSLEANGERTCPQLQALLPPSEARGQVQAFLAGRQGGSTSSDRVPLGIRWHHASGSPALLEWQLGPGCGLDTRLTASAE